MARRFCYPDWPGSDGDTVTIGQPINGVDGPMWPYSGSVYKTLAATYATGGHELFLPYGYRLTPPANGVWCNSLNAIDAASGALIIRAYDAGRGARDPVADGAARARIRSAAYWFDEAEFLAGIADCWAAMKWPVIDFGYYMTAGEWTYIGAGYGGHVWRAIVPWTASAVGAPGVFALKVGARAPSNRTADIVWGSLRKQAYTLAGLHVSPNYDGSDESVGMWHGYRSDVDGTVNDSGAYTTVLLVLPTAAQDPVTYHSGVMLIGTQIAEDAIRLRNGAEADIEDVCFAHVRYGPRIGRYSNTTLNGKIRLRRVHVVVPYKRAFMVSSSSASVAHCGDVELHDCSFDFQTHPELIDNTDTSTEPRSLASAEGISVEQRGNNVLVSGGWGRGGWHNGVAFQYGEGTDADIPYGNLLLNWSAFGGGAGDRHVSNAGHGNTFDGVYAFGFNTRGQWSCEAGAGRVSEIRNSRFGDMRPCPVAPDETWTISQMTTSGLVGTDSGAFVVRNTLFDTSNGNCRFGVALVASVASDTVGANKLTFDGVTFKVAPTQECALRVVHRADSTTQIDRSQTFKHLRIVQESGTPIQQVGFQINKSSSSATGMTFSTLAAHFNGSGAVHHMVVQGTAAQYDSGGAKGSTFDPKYEPQPSPLSGASAEMWRHDANPEFAWAQTRNINHAGWEDRLRYYSQLENTEPALEFADLEDPAGTYGSGKLVTSATEIRRMPGNYIVCRRVDCPSGVPGRKAFEHILDKTAIGSGWAYNKKLRSLLGNLGMTSVPFGVEAWAVLGVWFPPEMLLGSHDSGFYWHIGQCHTGANDILNNATMSFDLRGGNGDAAASYIQFEVRRFQNLDGLWPNTVVEEDASQPGVTVHEQVVVRAPQPSIYHYIILNYMIEPGYKDTNRPAGDQKIYGGAAVDGDTPRAFVKFHHCTGETAEPQLITEYRGWIGSPLFSNQVDEGHIEWYLGQRRHMRSPDLHSGIYSKHTFQPAAFGTVQRLFNRGWQIYLSHLNPGMTASVALAKYKQAAA